MRGLLIVLLIMFLIARGYLLHRLGSDGFDKHEPENKELP